MKIIIIDDAGNVEKISCHKIEPAPLARRTSIIIDEEHVIPLDDIVAIVD